VLYWIINRGKDDKPTEEPVDPRKVLITRDQLRKFDGTGPDQKVYIACNGYVFDVTGSEHYTGEGNYAKFAGRDISMACANYSTDE